MASYNEHRQAILDQTAQIIAKAKSSDRSAKARSRAIIQSKPGFLILSVASQQLAIKNAENSIMNQRRANGQDADTKITTRGDEEFAALRVIDEEEKAEKVKNLNAVSF